MCTQVCELLRIEQPDFPAPMGSAADARLAQRPSIGRRRARYRRADLGFGRRISAWSETPPDSHRPRVRRDFVLECDMHRRLDQALDDRLRMVSLTCGESRSLRRAGARCRCAPHAYRGQRGGGAARRRRRRRCDRRAGLGARWSRPRYGGDATADSRVVDAVAPVPVIAAGESPTRAASRRCSPSGRAGSVGRHQISAGRGGTGASGVPAAADRRGRDRRGVVREPLRRGVAERPAPGPAQLDRTGVGAGGPAGARRWPGEGEAVAHLASGEPLVRYSSEMALEGATGDVDALSLWAGQSVALVKRIQPAAEIVAELTSRV